jgi:protein ImuB
MMLWACLLLPSLSLDVFARAQSPADAAKPFAVATGGRTPRIVRANPCARNSGIHAGQLVSASLALSPDLVLRDRDLDAEVAALAAIAAWATQFTPAIALTPPDAVLVEIGGSLRLFGGLPKLTARLSRGVRDLGYAAQLAFAPTPEAALVFARAGKREGTESRVRLDFSRSSVSIHPAPGKIEPDLFPDFSDALAPLPLSLADIDPSVIATLAAAGITTFGQACALPRAALARRVGADFVVFLDRLRGLVADPRPPFVPPPRYTGKIELPAPVENNEALLFAVNRLVHELAGWLAGRGLGVIEMSLALAHERYVRVATGVPATAVCFALAAPAREPAHLVAVLRERLARVALPAPVEAITLTSLVTAPLASRNLGLLPGDDAHVTVPLIDRLRARLGEDAVTLVASHAEYRPERAWLPRGIDESRVRLDFSGNLTARNARARKAESAPHFPDPAFTRPLWLLSEPEPLGHLLEAQPWVLRDGPERIESGWWDGADVRRDYFVAESPRGETVWIYRDHRYGIDDGEWFLHGLFA